MYLTEQEMMEQHVALVKTYTYFIEKREEIEGFFKAHPGRKFVFLGCGSSFMLAKSAARLFGGLTGCTATAIAGGDYLVEPQFYEEGVKDSLIVTLSRSGQTSEIVRSVALIKENYGNAIISLSMKDKNDIMKYSDLDLTFDWCYDKSVCQTRTVTNLYTALLLLKAILGGEEDLFGAVQVAVEGNEAFKRKYRSELEQIGGKNWDHAIVLADGACNGIGEEGALAYTEIAMLPGQCFHLLDYRHGPMVLNDARTLNVVMVHPGEEILQKDFIEDLKKQGGIIITLSKYEDNYFGVDLNVCVKEIERPEAWGIPFIYLCQMTALTKALLLGQNPDQPTGLNAFITLK